MPPRPMGGFMMQQPPQMPPQPPQRPAAPARVSNVLPDVIIHRSFWKCCYRHGCQFELFFKVGLEIKKQNKTKKPPKTKTETIVTVGQYKGIVFRESTNFIDGSHMLIQINTNRFNGIRVVWHHYFKAQQWLSLFGSYRCLVGSLSQLFVWHFC